MPCKAFQPFAFWFRGKTLTVSECSLFFFSTTASTASTYTRTHQTHKIQEAHIATIRRYFDTYDKNNSNSIDVSELGHLCAALGERLTRRELDEAFYILDLNDNGRLSFDEFINWWSE